MARKTLLFHNGDYHIQNPLTVKEIKKMTFEQIIEVFYSRHMRNNTGTFLMTDTFAKVIDAEWIPGSYDFRDTEAKAVVTNMFHFISNELIFDVSYWRRILDSGIKVVPLCLGINSLNDQYLLNGDLQRILAEIAERNEIACRNAFSAEVCAQNGIKNVRVVGCPSMFYHMNRNFGVPNGKRTRIEALNVNFNTADPTAFAFQYYQKNILPVIWYFQDIYAKKNVHAGRNIDLTYSLQNPLPNEYFSRLWTASSIHEYNEFYDACGKYFFSVDDWIEGIRHVDFSIGFKWHGNVAALLAGVPAMFIISSPADARMRGFCEYHKVPHIEKKDFDLNKPIEYYYELADYTEFNKNYAKTYDNFVDFCRKNDVELKIDNEGGNEG